ncbi:Transglutaminase-like superfamily protein [Pedococcus cremeus]|uniref:Transglutaminase-like superfamily protein n=1 Tax=Pedococcus cremeus TaxID=587636 RepID=A0A1H9W3M9_9MICO|nr:transglutaminase domain-containing protein [Pedococcus cremeus]SES28389.1 Transglutaminase-like superfamily protein [Pedococcus cremeus]
MSASPGNGRTPGSNPGSGPGADPIAPPREGLVQAQPTLRERAGRGAARLRPGRGDGVDLAFSAALVAVALVGFRTSFFGWTWVVAAAGGLVLGLLVAHVVTSFRLPAVVTLLGVAAAYFLFGGPLAVRGDLVAGVIPTGRTFADLANALVHGWKRLVTMLPPVDAIGALHALPLALGLVGAAVTYTVARRWRSPYAVVPAPLALLALVIGLGTLEPASLLVQGVVFALLAIGWMVLRASRTRAPLQNGAGRGARAGLATGLLAVAAVAGYAAGPHLPGAQADARLVARSAVSPPFDVAQFPSPLAGFRRYTEPNVAQLWNRDLLRVQGLPEGTPLRFATLDAYDGSVWGASNRANNGSQVPGAAFQQVGSRVAAAGEGKPVTATVTVPQDGYRDVWLPTAGTVTGVSFQGRRAEQLASRLWLNVDTSTAVVPDRVGPGDSYTLSALLPQTPSGLPKSLALDSGSLTEGADLGFLDSKVDAWTGDAGDPWAQLVAVARTMSSDGAYTDGGTKNIVERNYLPGHNLGRIARFVGTTQLAGNDEQYAATLALVANRLNIPARVVMGAITPADGVVQGKDVHAWVEVRDAKGAWVPVLPKEFVPDRNKKPNQLQTRTEEKKVGAVVPPPAGVNPPSVLQGPDQAQNATNLKKPPKKLLDPSSWPWWLRVLVLYVLLPVLALLAVYGAIRGLKAWRRRRHATRGPAAARIAWAWADLMATARSYGHAVPRRATRLEQAEALGGRADTHALATAANAHVFGPDEPGAEEAHAYWQLTGSARRDLRSGADVWRRLRADVDVRPLFARAPGHASRGASTRSPKDSRPGGPTPNGPTSTSPTSTSPTRRLRPTRRATAS